MSSRASVLSSIRKSLGVTGKEATRAFSVNERINSAPVGILPTRGQANGEQRVLDFIERALGSAATVTRLKSEDQIPEEISKYLREKNLPQRLKKGADSRLKELPWGKTALEISQGASEGDDLIGLTHAFTGISESGTLVLLSGESNPTTLNFLPDYHLVVVKSKDLSGTMEEAFAKHAHDYGKTEMPRLFNFITGPSRSGDIEQKLLFGAHGPRSLHIMVVDE